MAVVKICKVHPSNISHTSLASRPTPIGGPSLHACCCRTISCHFVAALLAPTLLREHFQIGTPHSGFSAAVPDILVATKRGSLGRATRVSDRLRQLTIEALGSIGAVVGCWRCVYIHPATHRASSNLDHPIPTTPTHHLHLEPLGSLQSLSLVPSLQPSSTFPIRIATHFTPPPSPSPLPTLALAPPFACCLRHTKWLPTRRRQNRPWGTGLSNRRLVCSSRADWVGWKMDVTQASKARACRPRRHIPW